MKARNLQEASRRFEMMIGDELGKITSPQTVKLTGQVAAVFTLEKDRNGDIQIVGRKPQSIEQENQS